MMYSGIAFMIAGILFATAYNVSQVRTALQLTDSSAFPWQALALLLVLRKLIGDGWEAQVSFVTCRFSLDASCKDLRYVITLLRMVC